MTPEHSVEVIEKPIPRKVIYVNRRRKTRVNKIVDRVDVRGFKLKLNNYTTSGPNCHLVDLQQVKMQIQEAEKEDNNQLL